LIARPNDALKKLYDYQTKLDRTAAATLSIPIPKISGSDRQALQTALNKRLPVSRAPEVDVKYRAYARISYRFS
jgi:hypothetical protein